MSLPTLAIGVVTVNQQQANEIVDLLACADLKPRWVFMLNPENADAPNAELQSTEADIWLANLDGADDGMEAVLVDFPQGDVPVLYCDDGQFMTLYDDSFPDLDEEAVKAQQAKRMVSKLRAMLPDGEDGAARLKAEKLWILAASTGGPDAIAEFLKGLPPTMPGVALLYAQHTDPRSMNTLRAVVRRHCQWRVELVDTTHVVRESTLYIASPTYRLDMLETGILSAVDDTWSGFYKPSINQLVAKLARTYKANGGLIVFSGMGDDGAESCQLLHHHGGLIWAQDSASCTIDSMPAAAESSGCVSFTGTPAELSAAFVALYARTEKDVDASNSKIARL